MSHADVVSAVHHPLRRRLVEVLTLDGPATASLLAERTDQLVGNVSHHLKVLARAGMIQEVPELAKDRRERWWRAVRGGLSWSVADAMGDPLQEAVLAAAEQQNLAHQVAKVQQWYAAREGYDETWTSAAYSNDAWIEVTADELAELGRELQALVARYHHGTREPAAAGEERMRVFAFAHAVPGKP